MARALVFSSLLCLALGSSLPPWATQAGLGFLEGFLSQNSTDVDTCIAGAMGPVADYKIGLDDIKEGIEKRNLTLLVEGFASLRAIAKDLPAAMQECKVAETDLKAILQVVKEFHSLKEILDHIKADLMSDNKGEIAADFELMLESFDKKNYVEFGNRAGNLLHRLLVGRYPNGIVRSSESSLPPWAAQAGIGFLEGFLSQNSADVDTCIAGAMGPAGDAKIGLDDIKEGILKRNLTLLEEGFTSLYALPKDLQAAMQQCKVAETDMTAILKVVKEFHSIKDVFAHMKADINADTNGEIAANLELMLESFKQQKYDEFGNHAGKLLHRLLIAPYPSGTIVV